jgi:hypothetical protein
MNKYSFTAVAVTALLAIGGVVAGEAGAVTFESGPPLSPAGQLPLSPISQQNAVRAAKDYLDYTAFSRQGLIRQLVTIDDYSAADATSAVDSLTVDWNEQAAKSAKDYLDYTAFSRSGLITQLTSIDGYTPAQAVYGVAQTGL